MTAPMDPMHIANLRAYLRGADDEIDGELWDGRDGMEAFMAALLSDRDLHASLLLGLLAVMHRDGGQHTDAVGVVQSVEDAKGRWHERGEAADIGDQWNADSSLAKWFPLTAERLREAEEARDFLARLSGSAICRATCIEAGEEVIESDSALSEHALTCAVESLRHRAETAESEVDRLRARVRVEADDVERAGVTRAHVEAWMRANGWGELTCDAYGWTSAGSETGGDPVDLWRTDGSTLLEQTIRFISDDIQRPGLFILDEMAAMEVTP